MSGLAYAACPAAIIAPPPFGAPVFGSPEPPRVPLGKARQQARLLLRVDKDKPVNANIVFAHPERGGSRVAAYIDREMHICTGGWFAFEPGETLVELRQLGVQLQVSGRLKGGVKFRGVLRDKHSTIKNRLGRVIAWRGAPDDWRTLHMRFEEELT